MNYDEKKEIRRKKYKKYTLRGVVVIMLTFLLEYTMEFLLDNIFESNKKVSYEVSVDNSENDYIMESNEGVEAPFKASELKVEIVKVEKEKVPPYEDYSVKARITNGSDTPLRNVFIRFSFDDGESSAWVGGDNVTIMPGKSYITNGASDGDIKDIDSGEVLSGDAYWLDKNKELFYTQMDFLLDITDTIKSNN